MALQLKQSLTLAQQLIMTPQLQQAIKLLQLSRLELLKTVHTELETNPVLEEHPSEGGSDEEKETAKDSDSEPKLAEVDAQEKIREDTRSPSRRTCERLKSRSRMMIGP